MIILVDIRNRRRGLRVRTISTTSLQQIGSYCLISDENTKLEFVAKVVTTKNIVFPKCGANICLMSWIL